MTYMRATAIMVQPMMMADGNVRAGEAFVSITMKLRIIVHYCSTLYLALF